MWKQKVKTDKALNCQDTRTTCSKMLILMVRLNTHCCSLCETVSVSIDVILYVGPSVGQYH